MSKQEVDNATKARMARQQRLTDDDHPLSIHTIISEGALTRSVGGPEVMRAQLHHLVERYELPTVTIQILPRDVGAVRGLDGSFTLLAYPEVDQNDILYVEHVAGAIHTEKPEEVRRAADAFEELRAVALCQEESVRCIKQIATL